MTDTNAAQANNPGLPAEAMRMTRQQLQDSAFVIESLLNTVMAMNFQGEDAMTLVEMAQGRAKRLNRALDSVNAPEVGA